jgi:hypothetical protein
LTNKRVSAAKRKLERRAEKPGLFDGKKQVGDQFSRVLMEPFGVM